LEFDPRVGSKACEGCTQGGIPPYNHLRKATEEVEMLGVINIILGGALLVAGRKLFWLFVGAVGFVTGLQFATRIWQGPEGLAIIVGLVVGVVFALLAILLQGLAIGVAGFFAGAYVLSTLVAMLGLDVTGALVWIVYVIGGILGVILVSVLFDWAIITLSSLAGASLVAQALFPERTAGGLIFIILFLVGVVVQGSVLRSEKGAVASR